MNNAKTNKPDGDVSEQLQFLRDKLSSVKIGARKDLSTSRHVFRGKPSYIVHDPVTFNSHRFSKFDYQFLSALNRNETLASTFARLVDEEVVEAKDEHSFYEFVLHLQGRGLLDLPINDSKQLYDRYVKMSSQEKGNFVSKLLFLKIPLLNPNDFLDRTFHLTKPLFSKWFLAIWAVTITISVCMLVAKWSDFCAPFANVLATRNLIILFVVMTALKVWHEFGHAYACKINGGAVPDMGALLMCGMPMAYVDVSSSWSFVSRRHRLLVGVGGMYFESIAAAIAVFVWAFTPEGIVNSSAHFVVLMASITTLLFNANPLMRYDGYYILSDVLGIPNLRQRSMSYLKNQFKKIALDLPVSQQKTSRLEKLILFSYGIAANFYQVFLVVTISFMLASQFFALGIALGASFVASSIFGPLLKFYSYMVSSEETKPVRFRALAVGGAMAAIALAIIGLFPMSGGVIAKGQLGFEKTHFVRMPFGSIVGNISVQPNELVTPDQVVMQLENHDVVDQFHLTSANLKRAKAAFVASTGEPKLEHHQRYFDLESEQERLANARSFIDQLVVTPDFSGIILSCPSRTDVGKYFPVGEEIMRIGSGDHVVRCLLNSEQLRNAQPNVGQNVSLRFYAGAPRNYSGTIERIETAGNQRIDMMGLTQISGGDIFVDPNSGYSHESYFLVEIKMIDDVQSNIPDKSTASIRFGRKYETLGMYALRRMRILFNELNSNG